MSLETPACMNLWELPKAVWKQQWVQGCEECSVDIFFFWVSADY